MEHTQHTISEHPVSGAFARVAVALGVSIALSACSSAGETERSPAEQLGSTDARKTEEGKLLASIELEDGHTVEFRESIPGLVAVIETGREGLHTPTAQALKSSSLTDLYRTIAPGRMVPIALEDAAKRNLEVLGLSSAYLQHPESVGPSPNSYTTEEQTWFRQQFCGNGTQVCLQGWDWAYSGTALANDWTATVLVGSEGLNYARFETQVWLCEGTCAWKTLLSEYVGPGYWRWFRYYFFGPRNAYFQASLTGAGPSTQISLATRSTVRID